MKKSSTDGSWTIYIGGPDGQDIYEKHQDGSYITYYNAFGRRIAMRKHTGPGDTTGTLYFFLADTLGSTSTILSSAGAIVESEKYYPYGGLRSGGPGGQGITTTDKQFTGQQNEGTAFGLYDYGARFYSTITGQFMSADPLMSHSIPMIADVARFNGSIRSSPSAATSMSARLAAGSGPGSAQVYAPNPGLLDRYVYVKNDPLRYTDPTGLCFTNPFTGETVTCTKEMIFILRICAASAKACGDLLGPSVDPDLMHTWAQYGTQTEEFEGNQSQIWDPLSGADRADVARRLGHPELLPVEEGGADNMGRSCVNGVSIPVTARA